MATDKPVPFNVAMSDALSRTNAWVSRAGVVLDPSPVYGGQAHRGSVQTDQKDLPGRGELTLPSELASALLQIDTSADKAEHQQAKEQARLLQRFQQLKQWQHQQHERLLRQQQEQLEMLRLEQQRVEQTLVAQRQKQWGGFQQTQQSPPRARTGPRHQGSPASSPLRSTLPDALAKASISLAQTAGPLVLNPLLMKAQEDAEGATDLRAELDLASEVASSVAEEGVYPLPETASEMSYGYIDDDKDAAAPSDGGNKVEDEAQERKSEDEVEADSSLDESLQDAASLNKKMNNTSHSSGQELEYGDDRPIQSAFGSKAKTFEELLEQKLKAEMETHQPAQTPPQSASAESPRRQFLRKGAGTARFGVISRKPPKPPSPRATWTAPACQEPRPGKQTSTAAGKLETSKKNSSQKVAPVAMSKLSLLKPERKETGKDDEKRKHEKGTQGKKDEAPQMARKVASKPPVASKPIQDPLSKQVLPHRPKQTERGTGQASQGQDAGPKAPAVVVDTVPAVPRSTDIIGQDLVKEGALPDDTIEMSFQMRMKEWELNEKVEQEELDEFELLEEAADDNASFTSDASVVVNMMQRAAQRKERHDNQSHTLQVPTTSTLAQKPGGLHFTQALGSESKPHDESHDKPHDVAHELKQCSGQETDGSEDESFTVGDQTLTGDTENGNSPELQDRGRAMQDGRQRQAGGSATEEDSDDRQEESDVEMPSESQQRATLLEDQVVGHHKDIQQKAIMSKVNDEEDTYKLRERSGPSRGEGEKDSDLDEDDVGESDGKNAEYEDDSEDNSEIDAEKPSQTMKRKAATSSHAADVDFDDDESWGDFGEAVPESSDDNEEEEEEEEEEEDVDASVILAGAPAATSTPPAAIAKKGPKSILDRRKEPARETSQQNTVASPPTSTLVAKLFPKLKPTQKTSQQGQEKMQTTQPSTKTPEQSAAEGLQSKLLKEKLIELEAEITKFRRENSALAKLREEREKGLAALDKEVVDFQKLKAEELKNLQEYKEEEMKKLKKERRTFEKYQKAARALPDKKDREEMEILRKQLSDLQEEMSRRETRWTASSTRLRDRIDILEKENEDLREEVKLLEQQRLRAWRREEDKAKANLQKPKQQVPAISKQKLPPLNSILDPEPVQDIKETADTGQETVREKPKAPEAVAIKHPQVANPKVQKVDMVPGSTASSSEDDAQLSSQPRKPPQRKRSVRFDFDDSPQRHPSMTTTMNDSLDLFSPVRDDGRHEAGVAMSPKGGLDSSGRQPREGNRSLNNNNDDKEEIHHPDGKIEEIRSDGSRVITYSNQTRKEISADGQSIIVTFFNGDIKQIMPDQRVMYYYAETQTTHTTYPDGLEIIQFSNNQTEKHYPNGTKEITFPDQTIKYLFPNGNEESIFPDGTVLRVERNGDRTMEFPNGQREVHTSEYKRREYPDGTVKTVYQDGRQETRYSSGRIRVKDKDGRVILDKK